MQVPNPHDLGIDELPISLGRAVSSGQGRESPKMELSGSCRTKSTGGWAGGMLGGGGVVVLYFGRLARVTIHANEVNDGSQQVMS